MKYVKYSIIALVCVLGILISGRITKAVAYGLQNHEVESCGYPDRSRKQVEPVHAGETGLLKKHICP